MTLAQLTPLQREALTDLLVLGMYSDRHVASAENEAMQKLAGEFGLESDYDRQQFVDASFARVNRQPDGADARRHFLLQLAQNFHSSEQKGLALATLRSLLASDSKMTGSESDFLRLVQELIIP
jgi:hypothetical protein